MLYIIKFFTSFKTMLLRPEFGGRKSKHVDEIIVLLYTYIQDVPEGNVSILRGHSIDNSTINISVLCSLCEDRACCLSECVLMFLYAGNNIDYGIEQFVSCTHLQQPTDASLRFSYFIQWRSTEAVTDNFGPKIQTPVQ